MKAVIGRKNKTFNDAKKMGKKSIPFIDPKKYSIVLDLT